MDTTPGHQPHHHGHDAGHPQHKPQHKGQCDGRRARRGEVEGLGGGKGGGRGGDEKPAAADAVPQDTLNASNLAKVWVFSNFDADDLCLILY